MHEGLADCDKIKSRLIDVKIGKRAADQHPRISVVVPAYNISEFVAEALDSVFAQTIDDFEVIVVNDGSRDTERLERVLHRYFDRIVYARQQNLGAAQARNAAICLSRGEIIAFLDGDDMWTRGYLEAQVRHLESNRLDMVYCNAELFGEPYVVGDTYMDSAPSVGEVTPISLMSAECNVITSGTVLRKIILAEAGLFDTRLKRAQDFDLWLRLARNGARIGYQTECLIKYRVSASSLSGSNVQRAERSISILEFVRDEYELDPEEAQVLEHQLREYDAELQMEKGKFLVIREEYSKAREHLLRANQHYKKPKIAMLAFLLRVSPGLVRALFKRLRPGEFAFISPTEE